MRGRLPPVMGEVVRRARRRPPDQSARHPGLPWQACRVPCAGAGRL